MDTSKDTTYLCYSGKCLGNTIHFDRIKGEVEKLCQKRKISTLAVLMGTNDADAVSVRVQQRYQPELEDLKADLTTGKILDGTVNAADPLNLIGSFDSSLAQQLTDSFKPFFGNLCTLKQVCSPDHTVVLAPGQRYKLGVDNHIAYNSVVYYLTYLCFQRASDYNYFMVHNFIEEWFGGTSQLEDIHSIKERVELLSPNNENNSHGLVHYSRSKYSQILHSMRTAFKLCDKGFPTSFTKYILGFTKIFFSPSISVT